MGKSFKSKKERQNHTMFKGVLFDLDGVIADTAEYHFIAWKNIAEDIGIEIDRAFNEKLKGVSREDSLNQILNYGGKENCFSAEEVTEMAVRKNNHYVEMIQNISPNDVYPGIRELLQELKDSGIKTALASSSKNGRFLLKQMELTDYFDAIADPRKVAVGKPSPDIFVLAAEEIGLNADECIGIEDAEAGVRAILASGALPVGVGRAEDLGEGIAVVSSTNVINLDYLQEIWKKAGN